MPNGSAQKKGRTVLVLTRRLHERILIVVNGSEEIWLKVDEIFPNQVRLSFDASRRVIISREELLGPPGEHRLPQIAPRRRIPPALVMECVRALSVIDKPLSRRLAKAHREAARRHPAKKK